MGSRIVGDSNRFTNRALELTDNSARFNDVAIPAVAENHGKLATFDRKLRKDAEKPGIESVKVEQKV